MDKKNILNYIIDTKSSMTKKQQQLCDFILENHQDIGLMTAAELAKNAGVGKTTVLRFVNELGFSSFFELKKEFHEIQKDYSDKWENVQVSFQKENKNSPTNTLYGVWQEQLKVLDETLTPQLVESFEQAINLLIKSDSINLLGFRPYRSIAMYLESLLGEFEKNVRQLSTDTDTILDRLMLLDNNDVLFVIAFTPYSQRVIDAAEIAFQRGIPLILVTDEFSSPISEYSKVLIKLESSNKYFTVVSIIAIVEALVVELGRQKSPESSNNIKELSNILREKGYIIE